MRLIYEKKGYQVFAQYDSSAEVIELFSDDDLQGYVGCADTDQEAINIAREWVEENLNY